MKTRKLLGILLALVMVVCLSTVAFAAAAPAEVATYEELVAALVDGGEIKLTADITVDTAITVQDGTTIDLNDKTLYVNVENSYYNNVTIKNGKIVLGKDDVHVCDGYFLVNASKTLVLNDVDMSSSAEGIKGYAVFHLKTGANLDLIASTLSISNNEYTAGYIVYAGESTATLDVTDGTTITGTNTNGVVHAATVIKDSTFTLTDAVEHGINRSAVTITDSNVTISGGTGRGITAQHGDLVINGGSTVNITDMGEATIELRNDKSLTVAETATVTLDADVNNTTSGTITGIKYAAEIGTKGYVTVAAALSAAVNGDEVKINVAGTYSVPTGKSITITGTVAGVVFDCGQNNIGMNSASITFNNVTFNWAANGWPYHGLAHCGDMVYNDCIINGTVFLYGTSETFNKCTFNVTGDTYNVWTYGAKKVEFNGCTFNSAGKSVLVYNEGATGTALTVTDTDFIASAPVDGKAAIEIDSQYLNYTEDGYHSIVVDSDSTATGFGAGNVSGSSLYNNKEGVLAEVTVAGAKVLEVEFVAQIGETKYLTLQDALNAAAAGTGNVTVEILSDIDLTNVDWNPVTVSAPGYPLVTVKGNGKTITGLNDMLFAGTWAGKSGLIINDLTIANSKIVHDENDTAGNIGVGAFIGYPQASETITLNNCHLVNSTVSGGHWTGGLIGMAGGYNGNDGPVFMNLTITGCSVTGSTITGKGSVGGVIGHGSCAAWTNVVITDTTVSGNTITSTGSDNNKAGAIMGTLGAAGQATTAAGETKTGGMSVDATTSNNTVTSNGTTITTIYGRQGTTTGVLTITGGCYENRPIAAEDTWAAAKEGYACYQNSDGTWGIIEATEEETAASATVTINVTPAGATIEIKKGDTVVGTAAGEYNLPGGTYTYTVSKPGYYTEEGTITVAGKAQTITVSLAKLPTLYTINKAQCENGKVTAQAVMAAKGSTIKVSATPAEGYKVWTLTVTDAAGNEIEIVDGKITMPASNITVSATFVYDLPFEDVADDAENYAAIAYMYENGLMIGTSTEQYIFDGDVKMTRSQIAQILYRLAGEPTVEYSGAFTDVAEGKWHTDAVEWAASKGIMVGVGDGTFAHNRQIKVVEMSALIYRYAQCQLTGECTSSDWATESAAAMTWCVENGVLAEGTDGTTIADRNLAAEMFYNVYNLLNK